MRRPLFALLFGASAAIVALAQKPNADFSGEWRLNPSRSGISTQSPQPELFLHIDQSAASVTVHGRMRPDEEDPAVYVYPLDGRTEKSRSRSTQIKWEGAAMLANSLVSGPSNYTIMERWTRSADGATLRIRRTIVTSKGETESTLIYESPNTPAPAALLTREPVDAMPTPRPRPSSSQQEWIVPTGTRVLLGLQIVIDTRHSKPGDRVYLSTSSPIFVNERMVIPQGSYVIGSVLESKRAGKVKGRSELNIRFESITLPNGVTRSFNSRPGSAGDAGELDRDEGRIRGDSNKGGDAKTVATTTAAGAGVGTMAGAASGHLGAGLGIGSAAGAAAGLAAVLLSRGPDVILRPGTAVEMVIDRDLRFTAEELNRPKQ
jgi:hypothetical protein